MVTSISDQYAYHRNDTLIQKIAPTCPCGSDMNFSECCEPLFNHRHIAQSAQQLMRSRYSAYTMTKSDYLLHTWHISTRPEKLSHDPAIQWIGLSIKACNQGQASDQEGVVEFIARYKINGRAHRLHETSRFVKENGRWFYLDGLTDS